MERATTAFRCSRSKCQNAEQPSHASRWVPSYIGHSVVPICRCICVSVLDYINNFATLTFLCIIAVFFDIVRFEDSDVVLCFAGVDSQVDRNVSEKNAVSIVRVNVI